MLHRMVGFFVVGFVAVFGGVAGAADQDWLAQYGQTRIAFDREFSQRHPGVFISLTDGRSLSPADSVADFGVGASSSLELSSTNGILDELFAGSLRHNGGLMIVARGAEVWFSDLTVSAIGGGFVIRASDKSFADAVLELKDLKLGFDRPTQQVFIEAIELVISATLSRSLGDASLAGESIGMLASRAGLVLTRDESIVPGDGTYGGVAGGNNGTNCWNVGEPLVGPDVIVGVLYSVGNYSNFGGTDAFSFGTVSCNIGSQNLQWVAATNQHPVIGQNVFRLKNGRFEQIGQAWLKHGFTALTNNDCGCGCNGVGGTQLGVGCSDPYSAGLNGGQDGQGPKFEVNAHTGYFEYPYSEGNQGPTGNSIYKRVQVAISDINPTLNGGGQYFVEAQYVTPDDAAASHQNNNCSYREIDFTDDNFDGNWDVDLAAGSSTQREQPAIRAWKDNDATVTETNVQVPNDGLVIVSSKATSLGGGMYHYEYAVQNVNCDRSIGSFTVPFQPGTVVQNVGFHDVAYHSGEPYDGTDWSSSVSSSDVTWTTQTYHNNSNANALRWGTLYNFRFDANSAPITIHTTLGIFKPGAPNAVTATAVVPAGSPPMCGNEVIETAEECDPPDGVHCDAQCQWVCGDGVPQSGEQCDDGDMTNDDECTNQCTSPACLDGITQAGEECDDGNATPDDGCTDFCTLPACGDGVLQIGAGEQCDDDNTMSGDGCSSTCQSESIDLCTGDAVITDGVTMFSTVDTTTDGPVPACAENNATGSNDVWFNYTATCNGDLEVSTCNTVNYNSVIVVYDGCGCGPFTQLGCDNDTAGCTNTSRVTVPVSQGDCYKIRIGGFTGSSEGSGTVSVTCTGTVCGDSTIEAGEECDPPNGTTCAANCQRIPICGDGHIDAPETCDDMNLISADGCSATCQTELVAPNNMCSNQISVGEGTRGFFTSGATTDGPNETLGNCSKFGSTQIDNDVWFCYTPTCNGTATVSLCGSSYDTKMAVYDGCACPTIASAIECNDDTCANASQVSFGVAMGASYLLRLGGYLGASGSGTMTISCAPMGCQSDGECADTNLCTTDFCDGGTCVNANNSEACDDGDDCTLDDACSGGSCVGGLPPNCAPGSSNCTDCNANDIRDDCEGLADCDFNGLPDVCEFADCNNNTIADVCDIFSRPESDCDGGPLGNVAAGGSRYNTICISCHGPNGMGAFGPNIQDYSRVQIWNMLLPPTDHPGGAHPEYTQQDFADLEAYLSQSGSRGRPDRIPDSCQTLNDCDQDGTSDACELEAGTQIDNDFDGVPDLCVCDSNDDCDDLDFCNGTETCAGGACVNGRIPCPGMNCNEANDTCGDCSTDTDCSDGKFCTGVETCVSGACVPGAYPCTGQLCNEANDTCVSCLTNVNCDDNLYCNGAETCVSGSCVPGSNPCTSGTCYEEGELCVPNTCTAPMVESQGCRYLKVTPSPSSGPVAIIVYGAMNDPQVECVERYVQADGRLGVFPVFQTPATWGTINVRGAQIFPNKTYEVVQDCGAEGLAVLSSGVFSTTWKFGDTANNGIINLDDILCVLNGFGGSFNTMPSFCKKPGVDLVGCTPNYVIDLDDILAVLNAFSGGQLNCSIPCQ